LEWSRTNVCKLTFACKSQKQLVRLLGGRRNCVSCISWASGVPHTHNSSSDELNMRRANEEEGGDAGDYGIGPMILAISLGLVCKQLVRGGVPLPFSVLVSVCVCVESAGDTTLKLVQAQSRTQLLQAKLYASVQRLRGCNCRCMSRATLL
jgi:hypothetical protein